LLDDQDNDLEFHGQKTKGTPVHCNGMGSKHFKFSLRRQDVWKRVDALFVFHEYPGEGLSSCVTFGWGNVLSLCWVEIAI
jgi:hypothetical protein